MKKFGLIVLLLALNSGSIAHAEKIVWMNASCYWSWKVWAPLCCQEYAAGEDCQQATGSDCNNMDGDLLDQALDAEKANGGTAPAC